jgi:hypothetical protein
MRDTRIVFNLKGSDHLTDPGIDGRIFRVLLKEIGYQDMKWKQVTVHW